MKKNNPPIKAAFNPRIYFIEINQITPLKNFHSKFKTSKKYRQILQSVKAIGLVEPLIVFPDPQKENNYLLLDGYSRLIALQSCGQTQAKCLISTLDDTYSYNSKVNRLASIQGVHMIIRAMKAGVPVNELAHALNLAPQTIINKFNLLTGICNESIKIMADQDVPLGVFPFLRRMKKLRQLDVVTCMKNLQDFSVRHARFLLDSSNENELLPLKNKKNTLADTASMAQLKREISNLRTKQKNVFQTFTIDSLKLTSIKHFIKRLLNNVEIVKWLAEHENEYLIEFNNLVNNDKI